MLGCAPEPIQLDLDPLRAAGAATLTLAVTIAGEVDVFVLDLDAPEPTRVLPSWSVEDGEPIGLEAHGYPVPIELFGLTPGRLLPPSGPSRPAPLPSLRRARTARVGAPGAWEDVAETEHLDGLRFPPHPRCPRITATTQALGPRAPTPAALVRLADGRWLLSLGTAEELFLLDPSGAEATRIPGLSVRVTALHVQGTRIFAGTETGELYELTWSGDGLDARLVAPDSGARRFIVAIQDGPGADQLWTLTHDDVVRRVDVRTGMVEVAHAFDTVLDLGGSWLASDGSRTALSRALAFTNQTQQSLLVLEGARAAPTEVPWTGIRGLAHVPELGFVAAASDLLWRLGPEDVTPYPFAGYLDGQSGSLHIIPVRRGLALVSYRGSVMVYLDDVGIVCEPVALSTRGFYTAGALDPDTLLVVDGGFPLPDDTIQAWTIRLE
jgi:hypothetical protein